MFKESNTRSLAKTISWRIVVFVLDISIAYLIFKDLQIASSFAVIKLVVATIFYYFHERIWNSINWGKKD